MERAEEALSKYLASPEYLALVYKMFRKEAMRIDGRLYRLPAIQAWKKTRHYAKAVQR